MAIEVTDGVSWTPPGDMYDMALRNGIIMAMKMIENPEESDSAE